MLSSTITGVFCGEGGVGPSKGLSEMSRISQSAIVTSGKLDLLILSFDEIQTSRDPMINFPVHARSNICQTALLTSSIFALSMPYNVIFALDQLSGQPHCRSYRPHLLLCYITGNTYKHCLPYTRFIVTIVSGTVTAIKNVTLFECW